MSKPIEDYGFIGNLRSAALVVLLSRVLMTLADVLWAAVVAVLSRSLLRGQYQTPT